MFGRAIALLVFTILLGTIGPARSQAQTIDFDRFPNGAAVPNNTVITTQYQSLGVTFASPAPAGGPTAGVFFGEASSAPHALAGVDTTIPGGLHPIGMTFAAPYTNRVDVTLISVGVGTVTATAYAANNSVLDRVVRTHGAGAGVGLGNHDPISLSGNGIARVEFEIAQTGPPGFYDGFGIDDVTFGLPLGLSFDAFSTAASITLAAEPSRDSFSLSGSFRPSPTGDGVDPLTEDVAVTVATFSRVIPAGAFKADGSGGFRFSGNVGGATMTVRITAPVGGTYAFSVSGKKTDLASPSFPVGAVLRIGDDVGHAALANGKLSASE